MLKILAGTAVPIDLTLALATFLSLAGISWKNRIFGAEEWFHRLRVTSLARAQRPDQVTDIGNNIFKIIKTSNIKKFGRYIGSSMEEDEMITVIGATGFTGTLIAQLLDKEQVPLRLTGRDRAKLDALGSSLSSNAEKIVLDVTDLSGLKTAIAGSDVVINCAGPFTTFGLKVAETVINAGVSYLDITGEQQYIAQVIERFNALAIKNECTAIPSCAFEYAMVDTAAAMMHQQLGGLTSIEATYFIEGMYTSRGTKRSIICALESPSFQLRNGTLTKIPGGESSPFPVDKNKTVQRFPFPGGEVYLLPLHIPIKNISTFLTAEASPAVLGLVSKIMPMIARTPLRKLIDLAIDHSDPVPKRTETKFKIFCKGSNANGTSSSTVEISGADPYYLTAKIVSQCAIALTKPGVPRGVISASMLSGFQFIQSITEAESVFWKQETL